MGHSIWKQVLCFIVLAISACAVHLPASACDRVRFFNGVNVGINEDKVVSIGALLEQGSGKRIESINVVSPDSEFPGSIVIYPIEDEYAVNDGCQGMTDGAYLCFATLPDRNVWISVRIEERLSKDEMKKIMRLATTYVAEEVLCKN